MDNLEILVARNEARKEAKKSAESEFRDGVRCSDEMELERKIKTGSGLTDKERDLLLFIIWQEQRRMFAALAHDENKDVRDAFDEFNRVKERQSKAFLSEAVKEKELWKSRSIKMQDRLDAMEDKIKAISSDVEEYKEVISKQKEEIKKQREIIADVYTLRKRSDDKADELTKELDYKNTELRCKRKELEQIQYEYEQMRQEYDQVQQKYEEMRQECDQKKKEALLLEEKLKEYHEELAKRERYDMGVE